jgi:hypothetical protein
MFLNKIRRKTMPYTKPVLVSLANSIETIQGLGKGMPFLFDHNTGPEYGHFNATAGAYEADE